MSALLTVEVANWKFVALLGAMSAVLFVVAWGRRNWTRWGAVVAATCLSVVCAADGVNTYFGYLPQVADVVGVSDWPVVPERALAQPVAFGDSAVSARTRRLGGVVDIVIRGVRSGVGTHHTYVYLPPQYFTEPTVRFPVVYLLHGSPGRPQDWLRAAGAVQAGEETARAARPMLLIAPPMSHSWLDDSECVDGRGGRWDTWLTNDVVTTIDSTFRTVPTRAGRSLAGMSAGGYCALNLLVRHSNVFSAALDMSGYARPTHSGGLAGLFGAGWRSAAASNTPAVFLQQHRLQVPLQLRFDVGNGDHEPQRELRTLRPSLVAAGAVVSESRRPGGHTYHVWAPALRSGIHWFSEIFYGASIDASPETHR